MPTEFTVIQPVRQHFGNEPGSFERIEASLPFVGPTKDFSFDCPNIDRGAPAVLMFQSLDVDHNKNILQVNDSPVFGGIPRSPSRLEWNGNIMLVTAGALRAAGNELHIESRNGNGSGGDDIDDFVLDNILILYKTR